MLFFSHFTVNPDKKNHARPLPNQEATTLRPAQSHQTACVSCRLTDSHSATLPLNAVVQPTDQEDGVSSQGDSSRVSCSVWGEMKRLLIEVWLSALLMWAIWTERTGAERERGQRGNEEKFLADREGLFPHGQAPRFSPPPWIPRGWKDRAKQWPGC